MARFRWHCGDAGGRGVLPARHPTPVARLGRPWPRPPVSPGAAEPDVGSSLVLTGPAWWLVTGETEKSPAR